MSKPCISIRGEWADYYEKFAHECEVEVAKRKAIKEKRGGDIRIDWPFGLGKKVPKGLNPKLLLYYTESLEDAIISCRRKVEKYHRSR